MVAEDARRNIIAVRRRMLHLFEAGFLNRARRDKLAPYVYFLSEKGSAEALKYGHLTEHRYIKSKSSILVPHDLEITIFHRTLQKALRDAGQSLSEWEQWRGAIGQHVQTEDGKESLIPDGKFYINECAFYLEVVKSYESEYKDGESNVERKISLYNEFRRQTTSEDFRVLFVMPTKMRVAHFLAKIEEKFPYRRFWFTDEESYRTNILGKIWWTPRDFRDATYGLLD